MFCNLCVLIPLSGCLLVFFCCPLFLLFCRTSSPLPDAGVLWGTRLRWRKRCLSDPTHVTWALCFWLFLTKGTKTVACSRSEKSSGWKPVWILDSVSGFHLVLGFWRILYCLVSFSICLRIILKKIFFQFYLLQKWGIGLNYLAHYFWKWKPPLIFDFRSEICLSGNFELKVIFLHLSKTSTTFHSAVSLLFSCPVVSDTMWPLGLQHARLLCPLPSPRACSDSCPLSRWCHPTISSSVVPFLLLPSVFPSIRVFSDVSALHIRWPKYWSSVVAAIKIKLPQCFFLVFLFWTP